MAPGGGGAQDGRVLDHNAPENDVRGVGVLEQIRRHEGQGSRSGSHSPLAPAPAILASSLAFSISAYVFALICVAVTSVKEIAASFWWGLSVDPFGPLLLVAVTFYHGPQHHRLGSDILVRVHVDRERLRHHVVGRAPRDYHPRRSGERVVTGISRTVGCQVAQGDRDGLGVGHIGGASIGGQRDRPDRALGDAGQQQPDVVLPGALGICILVIVMLGSMCWSSTVSVERRQRPLVPDQVPRPHRRRDDVVHPVAVVVVDRSSR